ncbi:hypothetical protein GCM10010329_50240 [Streptomyces spiroverticillatus]|uniref:Uncharacterized protein n=1 Tax=Streptomyces finlayi TaxID=67296 RepID=A0A919CBT9_9ACTN|nr:hypothetical protein [Streptomyces finlayi]GHA20789.1 hypothetical protein GCM10010329_50240 [Streptomyces spiroverticillatus]GHD03438.1 hypothetical protein GCM10010334_51190 [Streptomyces finlayi]
MTETPQINRPLMITALYCGGCHEGRYRKTTDPAGVLVECTACQRPAHLDDFVMDDGERLLFDSSGLLGYVTAPTLPEYAE